MLRVFLARSHTYKHVLPVYGGGWPFADCLQPHDAYQMAYSVTTCMEPISRQVDCKLVATPSRQICNANRLPGNGRTDIS